MEVARAGLRPAAGRDQSRVDALFRVTQFSKCHLSLDNDGRRNCTKWTRKGERLRSEAVVTLALGKGPPESLVWVLLLTLSCGFEHWKALSSSLHSLSGL